MVAITMLKTKFTRLSSLLFALGFGCFCVVCAGNAAPLDNFAAPLQLAEWVKGGPVNLADGKGKTIYVVEFWATWCPPCRKSIPHLTELQAKYKDQGVVVVGISDEKPAVVKACVQKMGAKMEYVVGIDDKNQTDRAYMEAYKQNGIPTAFIIDKTGTVVWIGNPLGNLDKVLEQVVAGKFEPKPLVKVEVKAGDAGSDADAETDAAADAENELQDDYFAKAAMRSELAATAEAGEAVLLEHGDDPQKMNDFSWRILTDESLEQHDYPLALRAVEKAFQKSKGQEFAIVDTYARALLMTGRTNDAIAMQQKAVARCDNPMARLELQETLAGYQHPAPDSGLDDRGQFRRLLNESIKLLKAKKTRSAKELLAQAKLTPCAVKLTKSATQAVGSEQLYEQARASVLVVCGLGKNPDTDEYEAGMASGFIIDELGVFVTNFHVVNQADTEALTAMTADGRVYPVKSVLAVSPFPDIAICQLDGAKGLKPLPLAPNAKPGAHIRILSHPDQCFYSLTEGILSRYFVYREQGKATQMFTTTAEFAVGSSGGPLFDDRGNVVGMVSSTSSIYSGSASDGGNTSASKPAASDESSSELQMVLKMCVPANEILKLIQGAK